MTILNSFELLAREAIFNSNKQEIIKNHDIRMKSLIAYNDSFLIRNKIKKSGFPDMSRVVQKY